MSVYHAIQAQEEDMEKIEKHTIFNVLDDLEKCANSDDQFVLYVSDNRGLKHGHGGPRPNWFWFISRVGHSHSVCTPTPIPAL